MLATTLPSRFRPPRWLRLCACLWIALLTAGCQQDDDDGIPTPVIQYLVEYRIDAVSEVDVQEITYIDEQGQEVTVPGDKNFNLRFRAESGRRLAMRSIGTIDTVGYVAVKIEAFAVGGGSPQVAIDDLGYSDNGTVSFDLSAELTLE